MVDVNDQADRAGPPPALARPYSWTEGRTQPSVDIAVEARVVTTPAGRDLPPRLTSAAWTITQLCLQPRSVAELGAYLAVPLGVVRVLVADLVAEGLVHVEATLAHDADDAERRELIERVLSGLRAK
ncbi:DUF742 domain-containing protein [Actinophytocola algeriensis]|uniref:DUF742 domain-containing protein n=1 Tax=Actinophytocola algeriensis TaxID=1768010 RepID=A0A7W7Q520_9PSEU|nr:DUF742 domain-containing protein [Actinophytocola algeriensis]MBB4906978.1 hypothetical protein [Actinophytocola algeriensis]MBE1478461.1 hypothetical protein [Actinophytocola algeriensis]